MTGEIVFDPLLPWPVIWALGAVALASVALALWRGMPGWALRFFAGLVLVAALTQPSFQEEDRAPLSDIVLLLEDQSASQRLGDRLETTSETADALEARLAAESASRLRSCAPPGRTPRCAASPYPTARAIAARC